jgi:hypothetical protein
LSQFILGEALQSKNDACSIGKPTQDKKTKNDIIKA